MTGFRVREYLEPDGRSPHATWFKSLNAEAAAKVTAALYQLTAGNFSNVKGVGSGVLERKSTVAPDTGSTSVKTEKPW